MFGSYSRIELLLLQGRLPEAERAIREALSQDMEDATLHSLLAQTLFRMERPKDAERSARVAIGLEPEFTLPRFFLAQALHGQSRHREALEAIDEAMRLDPEDADLCGLKSQVLLSGNRIPEALAAAEAGLAIHPDHESCRFFRSVLLSRLNRHDEAHAESLALLADNPEDSSNFSARGWVLVETNDATGAQEHFMEALRLDPENEDARAGLAYSLNQKNPVMGFVLRLLDWVQRAPTWTVIVSLILLLQIGDGLIKPSTPAALRFGGIALKSAILWFVCTSLTLPVLFHLCLRFTRAGKLVLSRDQRLSLRWAVGPLLLGAVYFVDWIINGGRSSPFHAMAWFAVARLAHEVFEDPNPWLRKTMAALAWCGFACAIWIEFATYAIILPNAMAVTREFGDQLAELRAAIKIAGKPPSPEQKEQIKAMVASLSETADLRRRLVDYPALALWAFGSFADDVRNWLKGRAPDA